MEDLKTAKYYTFLEEQQFFLLFAESVRIKMKKIFKNEESFEILKILDLVENI